MQSKCSTCIYGGYLAGPHGEAWQIIYQFDEAIYKDTIQHVINYKNGDHGCRSGNFKSKEQVCLNNTFSEYKTIQNGEIINVPGTRQK